LKPLLGIDFGTSTARAAVATDRELKMVTHVGGGLSIPSIVAFPSAASGGGPPLVGAAAQTVSARHPERTVMAVKRLLGRRLESPEVRHHRQTVPYDLVAARSGDMRVRVGRRHHAPQDIAGYIIGALRAAAERQVGETISDVVLAVPALFNDLQRQAIRDAARIAGLNVLGLLSESSAAVLGSGIFPMRRGQERKVLVYHLGGGSCEVAAVLVGAATVEVAGVGGDAFLGGEDFDQRIVALICEEIMRSDGGNPRGDPHHDRAFLARLRDAAEQAKIQLSTLFSADVPVPLPGEPDNVFRLERSRLETLIQDLIDRTVWSCEAALRDAKWSVSEIETVLLSGGQARMPRIRAQLTEVCGRTPFDVPASEAMVALGAAQQAATLAGAGRRRLRARGRSLLTERTGLSLGIESAGGVFTTLIPRGTPLPASWMQAVSTSVDGQTQIVIHLLQGEREMAADNESVAQVQIGPLPARPRGEIQLEVEIGSDGGGLPTAKARWADETEVKQVRVRPSAGLNENEIAALAAVRTGGRAADGAIAVAPISDDAGMATDAGGDVTSIDVIDPTLQGG
jgi:molecular chaperone DnaK